MSETKFFGAELDDYLLSVTGATSIAGSERIQTLWSGYGEIVRVALSGRQAAAEPTVIAKHVQLGELAAQHPRGWNTDLSHQRKVQSYHVETAWYRDWTEKCPDECRVPRYLGDRVSDDCLFLVIEDLCAAGYSETRSRVDGGELLACLRWLASFHARFLGAEPDGLWPQGTYWHLDTRPDEWRVLADGDPIKAKAKAIDERLRMARYQTLVHGDAKLANFCFTPRGAEEVQVAAVDFQYVGRGCGIRDVAYFIGSCLDETQCSAQEEALLAGYFEALRAEVPRWWPDTDLDALEREWRQLYPYAWSDFTRFLKGWCPDHWKIHQYSEGLLACVLGELE